MPRGRPEPALTQPQLTFAETAADARGPLDRLSRHLMHAARSGQVLQLLRDLVHRGELAHQPALARRAVGKRGQHRQRLLLGRVRPAGRRNSPPFSIQVSETIGRITILVQTAIVQATQ